MLLFTFSGTAVLLGLALLCATVVGSILLLRYRLRQTASSYERNLHKRTYRFSEPIHGIAFCVAIASSLLAINWTTPATGQNSSEFIIETDEVFEFVIPATPPPAAPPPPPPPPVIEPIPADLLVDPPPFENQDLDPSEPVEPVVTALPTTSAPVAAPTAPAPPPLPPPPAYTHAEEDNSPVLFAARMPTFGEACANLSGPERRLCSDRALMAFIYEHITYPAPARENGIEGSVVLAFVVEKDGSVSSVEALREVGDGCTAAALRALEEINAQGRHFEPGRQNGRNVRVKFTLPIQFKLE